MPLDITSLPMPKKPSAQPPVEDYEGSDEEESKESPEEEGGEDLDDLTNKVLESIPDDKLIEECKKRGIPVKDESSESPEESLGKPAPLGAAPGSAPSMPAM